MLLTIIGVFFWCWGPKWILNVLKRHELDVLHTDQAFYIMVRHSTVQYTIATLQLALTKNEIVFLEFNTS